MRLKDLVAVERILDAKVLILGLDELIPIAVSIVDDKMVLIANQIYKFKRLVQIRIDFETRAFMNFDEPSLLIE